MGKYRNVFFSEAIELIELKLCINHWKVLYKLFIYNNYIFTFILFCLLWKYISNNNKKKRKKKFFFVYKIILHLIAMSSTIAEIQDGSHHGS
jgi:hypothetical protein